ncbi:MAG TPA: ATP-binding protein, partial [Polyangiaceae bacterium]|nr:ATP-binding protein [Polyangiaceae bacterium]
LLRVARRMASGLRAQWFAVNVETPATLKLPAEDRARLTENMRLAEQLGAETATLTGGSAAEAVLSFARDRNVTKIVAGKPRARSWRDRIRMGFVDELIRGSSDIDIYVTVGDDAKLPSRPPPARAQPEPADGTGYLMGALTTALATVAAFLLFGRQHLADVVMTYLIGIVFISMRFHFRAAVASAILSVLAFDFFFIPPYLTFSVADLRHTITFLVMLLVAVVIAGLTQRVKDQVQVARRSERRTAVLYAMSRELSNAETVEGVLEVACRHIDDVFEAQSAVFTRNAEHDWVLAHVSEGLERPDDKEVGIARWVWNNRREAGRGTGNLPAGKGFYLPLAASGRDVVGVLGIFPNDPLRFRDPEQRRMAEALATQMALAMERAQLSQETQRARLQVEAEQLRSTLLSSVSHDLRTPIAVMKGAASTLVEDDAALEPGTRRDLAETLLEETDRLERLVRNLLDMTRLESGAVRIQKEWQSVEETVGGALSRVDSRLKGRKVTTRVPGELLAPFDSVLIEQVLINLLENAAKHTRAGTPIEIRALRSRSGEEVIFEVADRGGGLQPGEEERVFEKFHRGRTERRTAGVGLGLTICDAIVRAHGGRIWAENREGGGASFKFALPLDGEAPAFQLPEIEDKSA